MSEFLAFERDTNQTCPSNPWASRETDREREREKKKKEREREREREKERASQAPPLPSEAKQG